MARFDAVKAACDAIDEYDDLSAAEKKFAKASIRYRPLVRMRASRMITEHLQEQQMVTADGEIAAAVDWEKIIEILKIIMPLILMFI